MNNEKPEKKETRRGFGDGLLQLGEDNPNVVALAADLSESLRMDGFKKTFPERFFQCGVAEANMMGLAAGMAIGGKIPFTGTFANFSTGRVYDQIRQSIAYSNKNVKICASHQGLTLGEDGATHQILEDIGLMRMLPNMTVIVPCDYNQTKAATIAIAEHKGPVYLRFGRPKWPNFTPEDQKFEIGKAQILKEGSDVTIFAAGHMVWYAIEAAKSLLLTPSPPNSPPKSPQRGGFPTTLPKGKGAGKSDGIVPPLGGFRGAVDLGGAGINAEIINIHTIKPLDVNAVIASVKKTNCVVTAEEHQIHGGLGGAISECLAQNYPVPQEFVAVKDSFGESGKPEELLQKYGLAPDDIVKAVQKVVARKALWRMEHSA